MGRFRRRAGGRGVVAIDAETMGVTAVALLIMAAAMHAGWNALVKRRAEIVAFFWLATLAALAIYAIPFAIVARRQPPAWDGVPFLVASASLQVIYYVALARSYARGDLSVVYPIARGTGVLLVPVAAYVVFGERPTAAAWTGVGLVVAGIIWLNAPALRRVAASGGRRGDIRWPLLTGGVIATYSLVDAAGVRRFQPFVYLYLVFGLIALLLLPYALTARNAIRTELKRPWAIAGAGVAVFGTYVVVLAAMRLAPVSYVAPVREISIVFGTIIGTRLLGEPFGAARLRACLIIAAGVLAIGAGG